MMSCSGCSACNSKKTATNNQWAAANSSAGLVDHKEKTEFSNEWFSTNKMAINADDQQQNSNE